ncbi:hypothetical protein ACMFMF_010565 [Clarireedia jacksonii]
MVTESNWSCSAGMTQKKRTQQGLLTIQPLQKDPVLFNDSIFENVANGLQSKVKSNLTLGQLAALVEQACKDANIHDFISQLPNGCETVVGERGSNISGGEKQRIAIARAIISNPRILLLDEATSALDAKSEKVVQATLDRLSVDRTTIVISHKLSTIQKADKIILMKSGHVVEEGTHETLCNLKGAYWHLVEAQDLRFNHSQNSELFGSPQDDLNGANSSQGVTNNQVENPPGVKAESKISQAELEKEETWPPRMSLIKCIGVILKDLKHFRPLFVCGVLACIVSGGIYPSQSIVFAKSVTVFQYHGDALSQHGTFWALMWFVLALGVCVAFGMMGSIFSIIAAIVGHHYRGAYFAAILSKEASFFVEENHSAGSLTAQLTSYTQQLENLMSTSLGLIFVVFVNLVASCILSLLESWKLALVAIFGSLPVIILAGYLHVQLQSSAQARNKNLFLESARYVSEVAGAVKTISSLTMEEDVCKKLEVKLEGLMRKAYREAVVSMALFAFSQSASLLGMALAFWYGGHLLADQKINGFELFVIFLAIVSGGEAAGSFFAQSNSIVHARGAANQILNMKEQATPMSETDAVELPKSQATDAIEFFNVSFHYASRPEVTVLRNISFKANYGQNIAIAGPSGSGKSTIIALLERFYTPSQGSISFRNIPLSSLDPKTYRSIASLVSQETCLYQGSIRENPLLGTENDTDIPAESIISACQDADIHDFITSLPQGYTTKMGNKGLLSLSGGQRQRIAIARALLRRPAVLLLDEATSALDTHSELLVQKALSRAMEGRITITVAHRLSTVTNADKILVLVHGEVVETGTHDQLLRMKGVYYIQHVSDAVFFTVVSHSVKPSESRVEADILVVEDQSIYDQIATSFSLASGCKLVVSKYPLFFCPFYFFILCLFVFTPLQLLE